MRLLRNLYFTLAFVFLVSWVVQIPSLSLAAQTFPTQQEYLKIAGEVLKQTSEIQPLLNFRTSNQDYQVTFYAYGGTALELLDFARQLIKQEGSVEGARRWLTNSSNRTQLLQWHRSGSDLDFIFVDDSEIRESRTQTENYRRAIVGNGIFFAGGDISHKDDFFSSYDPQAEHLEPISNIGFDMNGNLLEEKGQNIQVDGQHINLSRTGLEDFTKQTLTFIYNPNGPHDALLLFKQYLRWLRLIENHPNWTISKKSMINIETMRNELLQSKNFNSISEILRKISLGVQPSDPTEEVIWKTIPKYIEKAFGGLEPVYSLEVLRRFGLLEILEKMGPGVQSKFVRKALSRRIQQVVETRIGKSFIVYVVVPLSQVRTTEIGVPWIAEESTFLLGYRNEPTKVPLGQVAIPVLISSDAVSGTDFEFKENSKIVVIKTENAIQRNSRGGISQKLHSPKDVILSQLKAFGASDRSDLSEASRLELFALWRIIGKAQEYEREASYFIQRAAKIADSNLSFLIIYPFADTRMKAIESLATDQLRNQILEFWESSFLLLDYKTELTSYENLDKWRLAERTVEAIFRWPAIFKQRSKIIMKIIEIDRQHFEEVPGSKRKLHLQLLSGERANQLTNEDLKVLAAFPEFYEDVRAALVGKAIKLTAFNEVIAKKKENLSKFRVKTAFSPSIKSCSKIFLDLAL